ncbi:type iib dna topoisomerase [Cystoisospora suis]|uniref:Type iib dna topoisomerase n=1 Tax=Cystoisospora suis TaxID=483139 RepID=A0A2C6K8U8_9APIC|nr:type iib dna topoisomerase [Cystoisospora suis]
MEGCQRTLIGSLEDMVLLLLRPTIVTNQGPDSVFNSGLTVRGVKRAARRFALVSQILALVCGKKHATLRELYYSNIQIYSSQREADRALAKLTQVLRVPRESLNVVSSSKAIVHGPIFLTERTCKAHPNPALVASHFLVKLRQHLRREVPFLCLCDRDPHGTVTEYTAPSELMHKPFPRIVHRNDVCVRWAQLFAPDIEDVAVPEVKLVLLPDPAQAISRSIVRAEDVKTLTGRDVKIIEGWVTLCVAG